MNKLDLEETTRRFHDIYEQVAKEYGYKTREDTKELDFNSPNGMTMLKTVEMITTPYLEEIERLNNIINRLEKELFGMYVDIAGWNEYYAKKLIEKTEESSQEIELTKDNKKDVSIKSDELRCQFSDIWEYGDR